MPWMSSILAFTNFPGGISRLQNSRLVGARFCISSSSPPKLMVSRLTDARAQEWVTLLHASGHRCSCALGFHNSVRYMTYTSVRRLGGTAPRTKQIHPEHNIICNKFSVVCEVSTATAVPCVVRSWQVLFAKCRPVYRFRPLSQATPDYKILCRTNMSVREWRRTIAGSTVAG